MTREEIDKINANRLDGWRADLTAAHATPMVLVGIGHDAASGEFHVCIPEDLPKAMAIASIEKVLRMLKAQI